MADGARHSLSYIAESTWGTTPTTTPAFQLLRNTSVSLALQKDGLKSEEIRSDFQIFAFRQGADKIVGDIGIEMSYGTFDTLLEGLLKSTWATDVLKAGTTRKAFTFERWYADIADKPYHLFTGCEIDKLSLTLGANAIVKGQFSLLGRGMSTGAAIMTGQTHTNPTTTPVFDSFTGTLTEGGSSSSVVTELSINIDSGLQPRYVVGSKLTRRPTPGWFNVTGTMSVFFEDSVMLDKFSNGTESSLSFTLLDQPGNSLQITIPRVVYTGAPPDVKGIGPITLAMPFQALLDATTTNSNIVVTRTPHV
jgi:hypothetical protein